MSKPYHIKSITEYHKVMGLPKPEHPLISVIKFEEIKHHETNPVNITNDFYSIALKKDFNAKLKYGQQSYDFDEGILHFMSPKQVLSFEFRTDEELNHKGWLLLVHPDFLWNAPLAKKIKAYEFFDYKINEALHLSDKEEKMIAGVIDSIAQEYRANIDSFSQEVIIAQLALLLTYSERFYQRQFITRKITNHTLLTQFEELLCAYYHKEDLIEKGIPTVQYFANELNLSANYLSRLLKNLTGKSTKHFIQDKVIDLAKERLSTTELSVSEIAYTLGFEHIQSFSKLFKRKTDLTPSEFRQSFH
ncbi:AraC family transcriptional regulator [Reichenbachiella sp. MSK19-1]|uniref:helix-turn-helix domain-containing protein n=1 Tax=Reichenbachiella sp. MSK19-1 TaxID=1897631 RepID=UPI000E6B9C9A|nr:helix-turn-helix transcriptional regulator [Reichenbachiella sp. MSK19-1]RJE72014.1 AraC family transcriptional regulator [Reichenbachiella sp. MSK19-1]